MREINGLTDANYPVEEIESIGLTTLLSGYSSKRSQQKRPGEEK